jgi:hypothetical protein
LSLEEKLRAYAAKGELVHLSLAFSAGEYHANFAAASPPNGYATGRDPDPVEAIEKAFKASPARPARVSKPKADTVTVIDPEPDLRPDPECSLPNDWTAP